MSWSDPSAKAKGLLVRFEPGIDRRAIVSPRTDFPPSLVMACCRRDMLDRTFFALLCCVGALPVASAAGTGTPAPAGGAGSTYLLIGQNWQQEFSDYVSSTGSPPAGASFYTSQLEPGQPT